MLLHMMFLVISITGSDAVGIIICIYEASLYHDYHFAKQKQPGSLKKGCGQAT